VDAILQPVRRVAALLTERPSKDRLRGGVSLGWDSEFAPVRLVGSKSLFDVRASGSRCEPKQGVARSLR
jgi:hypothetical protein